MTHQQQYQLTHKHDLGIHTEMMGDGLLTLLESGAVTNRRKNYLPGKTAPYSGTGGQADFVRAANRSRGGKAFIVLPSTAKGDTLSRIVPSLSPGTHVSTSKNDVNYVVTEYGVAQLRGKSAKQRARELIAIAHPNFRAELAEQAQRLHLT